jgi:hypothetical protein
VDEEVGCVCAWHAAASNIRHAKTTTTMQFLKARAHERIRLSALMQGAT